MAYGEMARGKGPTEHELRAEIIRVGRLLWERGYVAATDGNLSVRLGSDRLLVTASGVSKGFLSDGDLVVIDLDGKPLPSYRGGKQKPSSEIMMHLEAYRQRPDVNAVVHAHPPLATAFSIAGMSLARCVIPEVVVTLGSIPTTAYATPGTSEVPGSIRLAVCDHDALILDHHGSLTVGQTLWEAYLRLEKVEHTAQITLAAQQLGRVQGLSPEAVEKLAAKRRELLQRQGRDLCAGCSVCVLGDEYVAAPVDPALAFGSAQDDDLLAQQVARAVLANLKGEAGRR
jgi:L-fuculose-phosphate aldolase